MLLLSVYRVVGILIARVPSAIPATEEVCHPPSYPGKRDVVMNVFSASIRVQMGVRVTLLLVLLLLVLLLLELASITLLKTRVGPVEQKQIAVI